MSRKFSRREMLKRTSSALLVGNFGAPLFISAQEKSAARWPHGSVVGENTGMKAGEKILAAGGNAIDAAVAAALAACIAAPARAGIGGYGGHMIIALSGGKKITAIDFNTAAPAAASADMFPLDEKRTVKGRVNFYGWQAVGVPGILAGLQLALNRYGTREFREVVQPAIEVAEKGFVISKVFANTLRSGAAQFVKDPGSAKIYLQDGKPLGEGDILRNPELAKMLSVLAQRNSVETFYKGDIAQRIADASQKNGGLVTAKDLAAYRAHEVEPVQFQFKDFSVLTAPLTAGGLTILQALSILKALEWNPSGQPGPTAHARLEALRLAWQDRLELFGDPEKVKVPVKKLLSSDYAAELAAKVRKAVTDKKPVPIRIGEHHDEGTTNISAADKFGNLVAVTVTHGNPFGAQVTVDGLGLTLGHGMSRFETDPHHPNAPGPGKRPVINVCPSIVLQKGGPRIAVGGAGGMRIPNSIFDLLTRYIFYGASLDSAIAAPRVQCTGTLAVAVEPLFPKATGQYLKDVGFKVQTWESSAIVSAASFNPTNSECQGVIRGPTALGFELNSATAP
jgi:gamma-glutamyltranspeptidase / glutathione hydrolase